MAKQVVAGGEVEALAVLEGEDSAEVVGDEVLDDGLLAPVAPVDSEDVGAAPFTLLEVGVWMMTVPTVPVPEGGSVTVNVVVPP